MKYIKSQYQFTIISTIFIALVGFFIALQMPISLYPQIEKPTIQVNIQLLDNNDGFYRQWGLKIEDSLKAIEGVESVEGVYWQDNVKLNVQFKWNVSAKIAKKEVESTISFYQAQLPNWWPAMSVYLSDPGSENYVAVTSDTYSPAELSEILQTTLLPKLKAIEGVSSAWISDKGKSSLIVDVRPYDLMDRNVSLADIRQSLYKNSSNQKLGLLNTAGKGKILVSVPSKYTSIKSIQDTQITSNSGQTIILSDVADVYWSTEDAKRLFLYNDEEVIAIAIWPEPDANIYDVSTMFLNQVKDFSDDFGEMHILNSPTEFIAKSIKNIIFAVIAGMLAALIVVYITYQNISNTIIVCLAMPIALCISFIMMSFFNVGINLISLGAMSISIGMVVDGSIISVDRITKKLQSAQKNVDIDDSINFILMAIKEVKPSLISSTATSIVVFLPLAYTAPLISSILEDTVWVTVSILIASVYISLIVIPSIYVLLLKYGNLQFFNTNTKTKSNKIIIGTLVSFIHYFENKKHLQKLFLSVFFFGSFLVIFLIPSQLKQEVIAQPRAEIIDVEIEFITDHLTNEQKKQYLIPLKQKIGNLVSNNVEYIYTDVRGRNAFISIHLKSYKYFEDTFDKLNTAMSSGYLKAASIEPWVTSSLKVKEEAAIRLYINETNDDLNRVYLSAINNFVKKHPTVVKTKSAPKNYKAEQMHFNLNYNYLSNLLNNKNFNKVTDINDYVKHAIEPQKLYDIDIGNGNKDLMLSINKGDTELKEILTSPIKYDGDQVFINQVFDVSYNKDWKVFFSLNAKKTYFIEIWMTSGTSSADVIALKNDINQHLAEKYGINKVNLTFESTNIETLTSLSSAKSALFLSVCLVFLILLFQFKRVTHTFIVMSIIPSGLCGSLIGLYIFDSTLSLNSILGMLILCGLAVNNSIILLDAFISRMSLGHDTLTSIIYSLESRIKSVLVTNFTTIIGMAPLVIGLGPGKDILQPLGISISAGLVFSTLVTFLVFPILLLCSTSTRYLDKNFIMNKVKVKYV